jgi:hypothetical protein
MNGKALNIQWQQNNLTHPRRFSKKLLRDFDFLAIQGWA